MPKFKVFCTMETYLYAIGEAPDRDEAFRIAREDLDGGTFREEDGGHSGDWNVVGAIEYDGEEAADNE